jgi:hypothetical protein
MRFALFALALVACGGTQKPAENLMDDVRGYHEGLRWQRYEDAAARLPTAARERFLDAREELDEELKIDDYEITRVKLGRSEKKAVVQVKVVWHLDSVGVVHDTVIEQQWESRRRMWFLVSEKVKRGEPMPGLLVVERTEAAVTN